MCIVRLGRDHGSSSPLFPRPPPPQSTVSNTRNSYWALSPRSTLVTGNREKARRHSNSSSSVGWFLNAEGSIGADRPGRSWEKNIIMLVPAIVCMGFNSKPALPLTPTAAGCVSSARSGSLYLCAPHGLDAEAEAQHNLPPLADPMPGGHLPQMGDDQVKEAWLNTQAAVPWEKVPSSSRPKGFKAPHATQPQDELFKSSSESATTVEATVEPAADQRPSEIEMEARIIDEARIADEARAAVEARIEAEARARMAAEAKEAEEARATAAEAEDAEEARAAAEAKEAEEAKATADALAAEAAMKAAHEQVAAEMRAKAAEAEEAQYGETTRMPNVEVLDNDYDDRMHVEGGYDDFLQGMDGIGDDDMMEEGPPTVTIACTTCTGATSTTPKCPTAGGLPPCTRMSQCRITGGATMMKGARGGVGVSGGGGATGRPCPAAPPGGASANMRSSWRRASLKR